jgi:hypothetical protein
MNQPNVIPFFPKSYRIEKQEITEQTNSFLVKITVWNGYEQVDLRFCIPFAECTQLLTLFKLYLDRSLGWVIYKEGGNIPYPQLDPE